MKAVQYHSSGKVQPGMFIIEVFLSGVVDLVRKFIESKHERQVRQSPHLHLWRFRRVTTQQQQRPHTMTK